MNSFFLKLGKSDLIKGVVVAAIAAVGTGLLPVLQSGALPTLAQLQTAGIAGLTAGLAYLLKNLFTNSQGETFKTEPKQ